MNVQGWTMIAATAIGIGVGTPAVAQEGTPDAAATCEAIEPRDAEFFANLAQSAEATPADASAGQEEQRPEASPVSAQLPDGEVADDATIAEVTALYETLIDCLNRADYLRAYALYSEEYLLVNLSADALAQLDATPVPVESSTQTAFGGVLDARVLEDGAIAALVTTNNPNTGELLIKSTMTREDDGLRITEEFVVEAATPATPDA